MASFSKQVPRIQEIPKYRFSQNNCTYVFTRYNLNYNLSNFYLSLIKLFFGSMIRSIQRWFYVEMTDIHRSIWQPPAILDSADLSYVHDAIDISRNKFIPWGLNALVLRMKKDESLYDKLLSSLFTFRTFLDCWQNTFQTPSFNANILLFLYILTPSSFLLENYYERWRLLQHTF